MRAVSGGSLQRLNWPSSAAVCTTTVYCLLIDELVAHMTGRVGDTKNGVVKIWGDSPAIKDRRHAINGMWVANVENPSSKEKPREGFGRLDAGSC